MSLNKLIVLSPILTCFFGRPNTAEVNYTWQKSKKSMRMVFSLKTLYISGIIFFHGISYGCIIN
ncbi:hypothetical protein [Flavobacterium sp. ZS1P14]|uniref:hypothetical protein n=1 Tax=Flavobacterium sp. ZS1P14 TaxID=3401729 RepID=UPI003AAF0DDC